MSAAIEADGPTTLNRARDNLKLKPDSLYTGGHGPNPKINQTIYLRLHI